MINLNPVKALALLLVLSGFVVELFAQEIGIDICACQPSTYEITIGALLTCGDSNVAGTGIAETACITESRLPDTVNITDYVPATVSEIQVLELSQCLNPVDCDVVGQSLYTGPFFDGDSIVYTSIVRTSPEIINNLSLPRGFQVTIVGNNAANQPIVNSWTILYVNDCGIFPLLTVGQRIGWSIFTDLGNPPLKYCPIAPPTEFPTSSPTLQNTASPTEVQTAQPTAAPSPNPTTEPTAAPSLNPTTEPTESPTLSPATPRPSDVSLVSDPPLEGVSDSPSLSPTTLATTGLVSSEMPSLAPTPLCPPVNGFDPMDPDGDTEVNDGGGGGGGRIKGSDPEKKTKKDYYYGSMMKISKKSSVPREKKASSSEAGSQNGSKKASGKAKKSRNKGEKEGDHDETIHKKKRNPANMLKLKKNDENLDGSRERELKVGHTREPTLSPTACPEPIIDVAMRTDGASENQESPSKYKNKMKDRSLRRSEIN